jgi:hypothetical protein
MAKPITGKTHVGERREKRPNSDIYVYERSTAIKLEKKLENWLAQRFLAHILDWFDCIETTKVQTVMGSY